MGRAAFTADDSKAGAGRTRRRRSVGRAPAWATAAVLVLVLAACGPIGTTPDDTVGIVDGTVYAVAQVGDRTIIGGDFAAVGGVPRRNVAAIRADGSLDPDFAPEPDGIVYAVAGSPDAGRIFLGGSFTQAGGSARVGLAAVDPTTGGADPNWTTTADGDVLALTVDGGRLYAGGRFTSIGGSTRRRLAALDLTSGQPILAFNPWPDWTVKAVALSPDGSKVYAVGGFTAIGGQPRTGAAEVLASTGEATAFNPSEGGVGIAGAVAPNGRFYFSTTDNRVYGYDTSASNEPVQTVQGAGDTQAIAASATTVYIGGHFSQLSVGRTKTKRSFIGAFSVDDTSVTDWNPGADGFMGVWALAVTPKALVVGGDFIHIGGAGQRGFARFTGTP